MNIFHIVPRDEWEAAKKKGSYEPASLAQEGFIHCSKTDQLQTVANSFYKGQKNLLILRINIEKVGAEIKVEPPLEAPLSGILFPHIYGALETSAVEGEIEFPCETDGSFKLPNDLI
ncbi:MAG: DUF952 domain-containing protein [Bacteriovoracaceae bacterium]|nr:DUF952 domain-containing protein [Bacteriovoracaceae bacterium]